MLILVMDELVLPSGAVISKSTQLVGAFFAEEWAYYDGIEDRDPDRIRPVDVMATLSVNSFLNSAVRIRSVHRGMAAVCDGRLVNVPVDADLRSFSLDQVIEAFRAGCQVPYVLVPVGRKVLHRKRRRPIRMLNNVVIGYCLDALNRRDLIVATQDKKRTAEAARIPLEAAWPQLAQSRQRLDAAGLPVLVLRILEVLVWMWADPLRQYVKPLDSSTPDEPHSRDR